MTAAAYAQELVAGKRRLRKAMHWSALAHALLLLYVSLHRALAPEPLAITEIAWIEPQAAPSPAPAAARAAEPNVSTPAPTPAIASRRQHAERPTRESPIAPRPQRSKATQDRLQQRLAALQQGRERLPEPPAALKTQRPSAGLRPAAAPQQPTTLARVDLKRQEARPSAKPLRLTREDAAPRVPRLAQITPAEPQQPPAKPQTVPARLRPLEGASLAGPVADRPLRHYQLPRYPDRAKNEAIEGSVTLYFIVLPDGRIKENILVQKTAGLAAFDDNAIEALSAWRFEALRGAGEQWGTITFHYRLQDAGRNHG